MVSQFKITTTIYWVPIDDKFGFNPLISCSMCQHYKYLHNKYIAVFNHHHTRHNCVHSHNKENLFQFD